MTPASIFSWYVLYLSRYLCSLILDKDSEVARTLRREPQPLEAAVFKNDVGIRQETRRTGLQTRVQA